MTDNIIRPFEEYARILQIPGDKWLQARETFETARRTENTESSYRLLSALDYFINAVQVGNYYIRFILMVVVAERLLSKMDEKNKGGPLAERIKQFVSVPEIEADYKTRNDLVHGPLFDSSQGTVRRHPPEIVAKLADKWTVLCCGILVKILIENLTAKLPS